MHILFKALAACIISIPIVVVAQAERVAGDHAVFIPFEVGQHGEADQTPSYVSTRFDAQQASFAVALLEDEANFKGKSALRIGTGGKKGPTPDALQVIHLDGVYSFAGVDSPALYYHARRWAGVRGMDKLRVALFLEDQRVTEWSIKTPRKAQWTRYEPFKGQSKLQEIQFNRIVFNTKRGGKNNDRSIYFLIDELHCNAVKNTEDAASN